MGLTVSVQKGLKDRNPIPDRKEILSSDPFYVTYNIAGGDDDGPTESDDDDVGPLPPPILNHPRD